MKLNENTVLFGNNVILIPYRAEHVLTYHEWMRSPELLELTASEPLSLEEEYEMQQCNMITSQTNTDLELTFILLVRPLSTTTILSPSQLKRCRMMGDVNLFLPDGKNGEGECEIMIASPQDRRKGFAVEALSLFLKYLTITLPLPPSQLIARIGSTNLPSVQLFRKLGFGIVKHVKVFNEVELRWGVEDAKGLENELELQDVTPIKWWEQSLEDRVGVYDEPEV
nr:hypothetical protein L203_02366 [Cryptococcus depauperatus CBS 7841]